MSPETILTCIYNEKTEHKDIDEVCIVGYPGLFGFFVYGAPYARLIKFTDCRSLIGLEYFVDGTLTRLGGLTAIAANLALATGLSKWFITFLRPYLMLRRMFPKANFRVVDHHEGHAQGALFVPVLIGA